VDKDASRRSIDGTKKGETLLNVGRFEGYVVGGKTRSE